MQKATKRTMILMYKNIPVASMDLGLSGTFSKLNGFYNRKYMPPGTRVMDNFVEKRFKDWLDNRSLPLARKNVSELMIENNLIHPVQFYLYNHGLSLNDCYWISTEEQYNAGVKWEDLNYFDKNFSVFSGEKLLELSQTIYSPDYNSPNFTTNGELPKMWVKTHKDSVLYKTGTKEYKYQEVFNEVIASEIAYRLGINHVHYDLCFLTDKNGKQIPFSKCDNFCSKDWEFVSAQNIMLDADVVGKDGYIGYMKKQNLVEHVYQMLVLDYIIVNQDRKTSNFGLIRDTETLEIIGAAPVFDNGNSLWFDCELEQIGKEDHAKPFETSHELQIKLVENFDWYDPSALEDIGEYVENVLNQSKLPENRKRKIVAQLEKRIEKLNQYIKEWKKVQKEKEKEEAAKKEEEMQYLTEQRLNANREAEIAQAKNLIKARKKAQAIRTASEQAKLAEAAKKREQMEKRQEQIRQRNEASLQKIRNQQEVEEKVEEKKFDPRLSEESNGFG